MDTSNSPSDRALLQLLGSRISNYRLARNLSQADLADAAGISKRTLERLEAGGATQLDNFIRVLRALGIDHALESLIPESSSGPIEQLKQQGKRRKRASSPRIAEKTPKPWTWKDDP